MSTFRQIIWLVALAIFGATILLGPTEAKAHVGHKHKAMVLTSAKSQNVSDASAARRLSELSTNSVQLVRSTVTLVLEVVVQAERKATVESARPQHRSSEFHGCVSGCCDDCMACCGIAYNLGSSGHLYSARFARISLPRPIDAWRHDPEADRKPPRSIV